VSDVTRILSQIEQGDPRAAEKLLPLMYDELRKLAAIKLAQEKPGQTLQATALVHEAYTRLVDKSTHSIRDSYGHFPGIGHHRHGAPEYFRSIIYKNTGHEYFPEMKMKWRGGSIRICQSRIDLRRGQDIRRNKHDRSL